MIASGSRDLEILRDDDATELREEVVTSDGVGDEALDELDHVYEELDGLVPARKGRL